MYQWTLYILHVSQSNIINLSQVIWIERNIFLFCFKIDKFHKSNIRAYKRLFSNSWTLSLKTEVHFKHSTSHPTWSGLDGNILVQVWNIAHHFYLSSFRHVVKLTLEKLFLAYVMKIVIVNSWVWMLTI